MDIKYNKIYLNKNTTMYVCLSRQDRLLMMKYGAYFRFVDERV